LFEEPFLLGAVARLSGFAWSYLARDSRPVSSEFIAFLRREQRAKLSLRHAFGCLGLGRSRAQSGSPAR
jgi:hypothetical protein